MYISASFKLWNIRRNIWCDRAILLKKNPPDQSQFFDSRTEFRQNRTICTRQEARRLYIYRREQELSRIKRGFINHIRRKVDHDRSIFCSTTNRMFVTVKGSIVSQICSLSRASLQITHVDCKRSTIMYASKIGKLESTMISISKDHPQKLLFFSKKKIFFCALSVTQRRDDKSLTRRRWYSYIIVHQLRALSISFPLWNWYFPMTNEFPCVRRWRRRRRHRRRRASPSNLPSYTYVRAQSPIAVVVHTPSRKRTRVSVAAPLSDICGRK